MKFLGVVFICLAAIASASSTTKAPVTTKPQNVHLAKTMIECHALKGKWVEITLTDEGGDNGLQLDLIKVDKQKPVKSIKTPITNTGRRLLRRDDVVTFKDAFCLDYFGIDYAPCYDIKTSSQGKNLDELSWNLKISILRTPSEDDLKVDPTLKPVVATAVKEGEAFDEVKVLCGRLYKQLGKFSNRQMVRLAENIADDPQEKDHQKQNERQLRAYSKIAQKAEDLYLISSKS